MIISATINTIIFNLLIWFESDESKIGGVQKCCTITISIVIIGFDLIMLLHESEFMESWLGEMGFEDVKLPKSNEARNDLKPWGYDTRLIRKLNALDFELYDLAVELSHIGCEYLKDYQTWKSS